MQNEFSAVYDLHRHLSYSFRSSLATGLFLAANCFAVCSLVAVADVPEAPITADDRDHWSFRPLARP
ncbi:MAG: hypothetical protein WD070_07890, partial [Pirellulaceae bacterium]